MKDIRVLFSHGAKSCDLVIIMKNVKYKKRLLLRCIHHFKSDLIHNMDHMRISGTEPSSVILTQTKKVQKLKIDVPKVPKQAEAKRDGVHKIILCSLNATNQQKSTLELGYTTQKFPRLQYSKIAMFSLCCSQGYQLSKKHLVHGLCTCISL